MIKVSEIFDVHYGVNLELNKLKSSPDGINFVSRTSKNNGVSSKVQPLPGIEPIPAGTISVAGGGSVMESFLQTKPYYSGRDLYYLVPRIKLTVQEKLFYCACLRANKFRFNYGRQANRTLKNLRIPPPDEIPKWVNEENILKFNHAKKAKISMPPLELDTSDWKWFLYDELFQIERGQGPRKKELTGSGDIPFVTSTDNNNGWIGFTKAKPMHLGNTLGVNRNGSVAEAFYQPLPFCSTEDVHIFSPKFRMNKYIGLFLACLIRKEKYRFNYGRKWGIARMKNTKIKLPVTKNGEPDFIFMEEYIKRLPFSSQI